MADGGIAESALLSSVMTGAAVGGGSALLTGGDPLKGALMGGVTGGAMSGIMPGASSVVGDTAGVGMPEAPPNPDSNVPTTTPQGGSAVADALHSSGGYGPAASPAELNAANTGGAGSGIGSGISNLWNGLSTPQKIMAGAGAGIGATMYSDRKKYGIPAKQKYTGALSQFRYDPSTYQPYTMGAAEGGIMSLAGGGQANLGSYSDGGHLLKGPGDGMSDNIPASIGEKQPARLADGEFVVPADVVSHLGNGSTDAGAKQLYHMMDKVRKARTGNLKQGTQINPRKYMPA